MQKPFFSIIVVSLNPGERLKNTLESILSQSFLDYEVILKDGGSTDGSLDTLINSGYFEDKNQIKIIQRKDKSIYDGMNQAVAEISGRYIQFLNCGDYFYSDTVLEEVAKYIHKDRKVKDGGNLQNVEAEGQHKSFPIICVESPIKIYYGNQYNQVQDTIIYSAPQINDFTCYRNVPCHQVCFYDYRLFENRAYKLEYKVRADYEHFLYSIYEEKAEGIFMPIIIASYEGGGFSETKENRKKSVMEHASITKKYLGSTKCFKYRLIMWLTLAPVRTWIAENPALSGMYNTVKNTVYKMLRK